MPEIHDAKVIQPVDVVQSFYTLINRGDTTALGALIDEHFAEQAVVEFPPSLPYGGRLQGVKILRKVFVGLAGGNSGVGPRALVVENVLGDGDLAVAILRFDWYAPEANNPVQSGACETWRFEDTKVVEIRAYYWDTAALVAAPS